MPRWTLCPSLPDLRLIVPLLLMTRCQGTSLPGGIEAIAKPTIRGSAPADERGDLPVRCDATGGYEACDIVDALVDPG